MILFFMVLDAEKSKETADCPVRAHALSVPLLCLHVKKGEGASLNPLELTDPHRGSQVSFFDAPSLC